MQDLHQDRWPSSSKMRWARPATNAGTRVPTHHPESVASASRSAQFSHGVAKRRLDIVEMPPDREILAPAGSRPTSPTPGLAGQLHALRMIGVQVPGHEATAVGVHHQRCR